MLVYVAVCPPGEPKDQAERWIKLTPGVHVFWFDRQSELWLAVFPADSPDPGPQFRTLNANDRERMSPGSVGYIGELLASLRGSVA